MSWQDVTTGLLVAGCSAWAVWMLLPAGLRRRCRARLGLQAPAPAAGGCSGCSGCERTGPAAGTGQVVTIVRRPRA